MKLQVSQIRLPLAYDREMFLGAVAKKLRIPKKEIKELRLLHQAVDARKKDDVHYTVSAMVEIPDSFSSLIRKGMRDHQDIGFYQEMNYQIPANEQASDATKLLHPPVVVGSGPAGLFAAYLLAKSGYQPLVLERGSDVDTRTSAVHAFWESGMRSEKTNVQFGEGGAGTFSDGKLATMIKDREGRIPFILKTFVEMGADPEILTSFQPHIGTDLLREVVKNLRLEIIRLGGVFRFETRMEKIETAEGRVQGIEVLDLAAGRTEKIPCEVLILAIGHSARDTFRMLDACGFPMEPKAFAVGVRVEHLQETINRAQYGQAADQLPAAAYKLTFHCTNGHGVYSFCVCPGGYVVNASSEADGTVVNGMSYHGRSGENANSALVVTVTPEDFGTDLFDGMNFQKKLEQACFRIGGGKIPVQLYGDFARRQVSTSYGIIHSQTKGETVFADVASILPGVVYDSLLEGMKGFGKKIRGYDDPEAVFSGVETRTSSPVRILRNAETLESPIGGVYPCGEGAGYAGGITSAAVDGMKCAEQMIRHYLPC